MLVSTFNAIRSHRGVVYGHAMMLFIPFLVMGWTIGRYGPSLDDWEFIGRFQQGNFDTWDPARPLHAYSHLLIWWMAGGNVAVMQGLVILLEAISAVLFFEVTRRILKHWLGGHGGEFPALLVSSVYVLYPSYAARLGLIWIQDSTTRILTLALALLWVIAGEKDRPLTILAGAILAVITLLHKEGPTLVFLLFPAIPLFYNRSVFRGVWRNVSLIWYLALGAYLYWRIFAPKTIAAGMHVRSAHPEYVAHLISWLITGIYTMTVLAFQTAFGPDLGAIALRGLTWLLPVTLVLAGLIVAGGWRASRPDAAPQEQEISFRRWLYILLFGMAVVIAGLIPIELAFPAQLTIENVLSRNTTLAMLGASLCLGMLLLLPMVAQRMFPASGAGANRANVSAAQAAWRRYAGPALSGLIAVLLLAGGVIRQLRMDQAYVDAWVIQRAYWHRIADLGLTLRPNTLIVMDSFTKNLDGAPLAAVGYDYDYAFRAIFADVPAPLEIVNQGEIGNLEVSGDTANMTWYQKKIAYKLGDILVLYYDESTGAVEVEPHLPYHWSTEPVYTFTGENPSPSVTPLGPWANDLIGPRVEPSQCQTHVRVTSGDRAPSAGVAEVAVYPQNTIVDRRPIEQGAALNYSLVTSCGVWLRVYFTPGSAPGGQTARLISQYGPDQEYGTDASDSSPSYATAFGSAVPAELPH